MIVHETVEFKSNYFGGWLSHDVLMTVEFKFLQVPLWPSTIIQSPYHKGSCPEIQIVKLYIKHDKRPNLKQKW